MAISSEKLLIGAHTSAAGGVSNALLEGQKIGATTIQLFTSNQKQWKGKLFAPNEIALWKETKGETGITEIMSHDSYLINLGSPDQEGLEKSRRAFREELERCIALEITYLNFHPGAALKESPEKCLDTICESLLGMQDLMERCQTRLLLEATAGQGSSVGWRFEELAYILNKLDQRLRIGVCIDTCHIFAAGYDLRTAEACDATLKEFDRIVGLKHLYAMHLNDSSKDLGSRVDRHQPLGQGKIGITCFEFLMQDPRTQNLPKYLETPNGPPLWEKEIFMLRQFAQGNTFNGSTTCA